MARVCSFERIFIIIVAQELLYLISTSSASSLLRFTYRLCEQGGQRTLQCNSGDGNFLNITDAVYGRLRSDICSSSATTNCRSPLSLQKVARNCHGMPSCTVHASNSIFGDPCIGTPKYLEIKYACLYGDNFEQIPRLSSGYVYSNQLPSESVLEIKTNSTDFVIYPLKYSIYEIKETNYSATADEESYQNAATFLSTQPKISSFKVQNYVCMPNIHDFSSQFCVYTDLGYIFTSSTFIPGMYVGKTYDLGIVVRDYSPLPVVRKTRLRISVVPKCFPLPSLYAEVKSRCPSFISRFSFPAGVAWSSSLHGINFPIRVTSTTILSRIFIDTDLLVGFRKDTNYWKYEIKFSILNKTVARTFQYVPSVLQYTSEQLVQVRGNKLNITIDPPISTKATDVRVSLRLVDQNQIIRFNTDNAVSLFGVRKIAICPDSFCMNSYRKWREAIKKVKYSPNRDCIQDEGLQENYLTPCNSEPCYRSLDVPLSTSGGAIIYHFRDQGLFHRFLPSFYRVILYEYAGESFPGYSAKYFCDPKPFGDVRRYLCLNRFAGRLRVRNLSPFDFPTLLRGSVFTIEIQAEGNVNDTLMFDKCTFDIRLTSPGSSAASVTTPSLTTTTTPINGLTATTTLTRMVTPTSSILDFRTTAATKISMSSTSLSNTLKKTNLLTATATLTWMTPKSSIHASPVSLSSNKPVTSTIATGKPAFNETLEVEVPKDIRYSKLVIIKCKRSTSVISTIKWYKDGALLAPQGSSLIIAVTNFRDQGYYQCSAEYNGVTSISDKALFVLNDVFTSSVYLEIVNREFSSDLADSKSSAYSSLSEELTEITKNIIADLPSRSGHDVQVEKFSKGSIVAQIKIASPFLNGTDIASYYNEMTKKFLQAAETNGFGSLQVPAAGIIIVNKVNCLAETTSSGSKGPYEWPVTKYGEYARIACPNGPASSTAARRCVGRFDSGAFWDAIEDSSCNFNNKRTNQLNELSEVQINASNAESIASNLGALTQNSTSLTSDDALLASATFQNLAESNVTTEKIIDDMLKIASNLLQANESTLSSSQTQGKALTTIVKGIETLADKIPLPNKTGTPVVKVSSGVAIQAMKFDSASKETLSFALKDASISNDDIISNANYDSNSVEIGLQLPETLAKDINQQGEQRISFVAYAGKEFFQETKKNALGQRVVDYSSRPNSLVISAHVKGAGKISLSQPLNGTFKQTTNSQANKCVFWNFNANDGYGGWSSEGCRQIKSVGSRVECQCDHMTNFAILFDVYAGKQTAQDKTHEKVLGIISFIGIGLSLGGLTITLVTLLLFRRLRRTLPSKILIHLSLSLILTLLCFVIGADRTESLSVCRGFAIAIQYFLLACFCWMTVESINLYLSFVVVMGSYISRFILKAAIFAWGLPLVVVAVAASLRITDYGNDKYCIVSGLAAYLTMFGPICLVIFINFVVFARVFFALQSSASGKQISKDQKRSGISQLRIAASFSCILGLTWVFGIFAIGDGRIFFQYLFCIFNSLQGFIIFYLHVARHQDARNHWVHFVTGKGLNYHRATISSSSQKTFKTRSKEAYKLRISSGEQSNTLTSTLERPCIVISKGSTSSDA